MLLASRYPVATRPASRVLSSRHPFAQPTRASATHRWLGRRDAAPDGRPETQPADDPATPDPPAAAALAAEPAPEGGAGPAEPPGAAPGAELTHGEAPSAPTAGASRPAAPAAAAAEAAQSKRPPAGSSGASAAPPPPADRLSRVSGLLATAQPHGVLSDAAVFALLANLAAEQSAQQAELAELCRAGRPRNEKQLQGASGGGSCGGAGSGGGGRDSSGGGQVAELQAQVELRAQVAQGARQLVEAEQRAEAAAQQAAAAEQRAEEAAKQVAAAKKRAEAAAKQMVGAEAELLAVRAAGGQEVSTGAAGSAKADVPPWAAGGIVDFWEDAVGTRVVRGPDWCYGEQDGGAGSEGVVVGQSNEYRWCLAVRWLGQAEKFAYRAGCGFKKHDLRFAVPRPVPAPSDPAQRQQQQK